MSSSSRRTWIEILPRAASGGLAGVVLLAEDVDRNWASAYLAALPLAVVLLAEDVDRNRYHLIGRQSSCSRPPRGGRG